MKRHEILGATLGAIMALTGCAPAGVVDPSAKDDTIEGGKEDRWAASSDPARFRDQAITLDYGVEALPLEGTADGDFWPSTYWPTYDDSIQHRWHEDDLSPAEKYDQAFNGWQPPAGFDELRPFNRNSPVPETDWDASYYEQLGPLATHVSRNMGNRRDREQAVSAGGRPDGDWEVETWWGLCHAWVPAALLEDRPMRAVTHNGVTFEVGDIEALLIAAYNRTPADMIGGRCNVGSGDTEVERDETGRAVDLDCRDTNPGAMHVIVTNWLGLNSRGFAMDRTFDYEVWNQPINGYEITSQREVTVAEANSLLGTSGDTYTYNEDAETLYEVRMALHWVTESHASTVPNDTARYTRTDNLHYILEVDGDGLVIGGEWAGRSRSQHPDFLWNPRVLRSSSVPYLNIDNVRMLVEMSRRPDMPPPSGDALVAMGGSASIPDNTPSGASSTATIGGNGAIASVSVEVNITHTYIGDLRVALIHNGVERTLHNRSGGAADDIHETYDVTGFDGLEANGTWTLRVSDHAGRDVGTLDDWTITVGVDGGAPIDPPPPTGGSRFAGQGGVAIPDNDSAGVSSTASVSGASAGTVSIELALTHTYIGDLQISVDAPNGQSFVLHERTGGSADDIAQTYPLDATGNAFSGDPNGTWTLRVSDNAGIDTGTIDGWAVLVE